MKKTFTLLACAFFVFACKSEKKTEDENIVVTEDYSTSEAIEENSIETEIKIDPISHATAVINWGDMVIYLDPVGGSDAFQGKPSADLVLITDIHEDHMDAETLQNIGLANTKIIAPRAVHEALPESLHGNIHVLNNGEIIDEQGWQIRAIPMYNLREEAKHFHPQGRGNGYVLEKNGERLYIAGDTEDIPEMRNLENIDVALVPMNLPYTMPVETAADAVLDFTPKKVIPYHYRGENGLADVDNFRKLVEENNNNIEVELKNWYPNN